MRYKQGFMTTATVGRVGQVGAFDPVGGVAMRANKVQGVVHFFEERVSRSAGRKTYKNLDKPPATILKRKVVAKGMNHSRPHNRKEKSPGNLQNPSLRNQGTSPLIRIKARKITSSQRSIF
jgi:hypothetical protein